MEDSKVEALMSEFSDCIPTDKSGIVREKLAELDDSKYLVLSSLTFKKPSVALLLALLFGIFGADRFYLKSAGTGILKLIVMGGACIWAIIGAIALWASAVATLTTGDSYFDIWYYISNYILPIALVCWYIYDIVMAIPKTKKLNYKTFVKAL